MQFRSGRVGVGSGVGIRVAGARVAGVTGAKVGGVTGAKVGIRVTGAKVGGFWAMGARVGFGIGAVVGPDGVGGVGEDGGCGRHNAF